MQSTRMQNTRMQSTRRMFMAAGAAALTSLGSRLHAAALRATVDPLAGRLPLDYGRSFVVNTASFNAVRFWVESRTTIIDEKSGRATDFYQCGSCKSEHTFAERNLFMQDNYDFLPILGDGKWLIFRRPCGLSERYREVRRCEDVWGKPILKLRTAQRAQQLGSWEEVRAGTAAAAPIVGRTEIRSKKTALRAVLEYPVKTMNVSLDRKMYQVDTGPIAFPDLTKTYASLIESLSLAFVAFNAPHFADFVVEQPTGVVEDGKQVGKVYHYSKPFSLPAKNRLLAVVEKA